MKCDINVIIFFVRLDVGVSAGRGSGGKKWCWEGIFSVSTELKFELISPDARSWNVMFNLSLINFIIWIGLRLVWLRGVWMCVM